MELKSYQYKVIRDLETYLEYVQQYKKTDRAFNLFWEERIGPYNPLSGEGMQPYKNTIPNAAHVCIKVPTAGGKTFIACNALHTVFSAYSAVMPRVVVWLVPWSNLLGQTVSALSNPAHPYRQKLNSLFNHRVEVYEKKDLLQGLNFNPAVVKEQLSIVVMSFASLRAKNKEDRKVYQENGQLASFASQYTNIGYLLQDVDETSLINVLRSMQPVIVVDESHNAESNLSVDMLNALNPSFVLDLTATPKNNSNIISMVPAIELKKEHMVKLPVIVYNHHDKTEVVNSALHLQRKLELLAIEQQKQGGRYIRPIVLFQAQPRIGEENITYEKLKRQLITIGIPQNQIRIKTATIDELRGEDLLSPLCEVRYIITINALKEGWDCPFAYVLASLADKSSAVDVEQILGRVLRQPYVTKHSASLLNISYVLTASAKFNDTLQNIVQGLQAAGFSDKDYREIDVMTETEKQAAIPGVLEQFLFPEKTGTDDPELDTNRINFDLGDTITPVANDSVLAKIEDMAIAQSAALQATINQQRTQPADEQIFEEMGDKIKRYKLVAAGKPYVAGIKLPQFYLNTGRANIFGTGREFLSQEPLLSLFKLSNEDIKIDFEQISSDLYKVDIEETGQSEYDARFTKIEDMVLKEPVVAYILAKPPSNQVKDIAHQLIKMIGDMYPIADQEIRIYIERILSSLNAEQLQDILVRKLSYADKIKAKIKQHADNYAEERFNDLIKIGKIEAEATWAFPEMIVPGMLGGAVSKSLYEREGLMNDFETTMIRNIAALPNITFWHRNLGRGKGFMINGYKSNHYPDFIVGTKLGKVILIETKGDDRDNSDSQAKCRLGNKWAELAGNRFSYFMVFDKKAIDGAYNADKARELIKQL
ncbi:DEAD/DEAH box helicase [Mucilaginibacter ginsenosidivorax]|uniref:Restriction endonuclease n=1 Tax=Mucilaginibacter ginsenosidivorax TaxID=862126 RepID=A0A5B8W612_9SPHI|nr:DEAD/DEAH box helicase family protein [Mucilaginibacter ginsenosidivorax]QEC79243.1 restriction endonuclease [Mucilaginibacter ginsenosidivorax]